MSDPDTCEHGSILHSSAPRTAPAMPVEETLAPSADDVPGVAEWLAGRGVLVTGGTGFLGQLILEKILRACPDVDAVFLLVRDRRGESPQRRVDLLLEDAVFERVRCRRDKLVLVNGDLAEPDMGLKEEDRAMLVRRVNVVFHCAATVRFDSHIRTAAFINVRSLMYLMRLARDMENLQSFVHMSTMYAFSARQVIEERVYQPRMTGEQLLNIVDALDDETLERITPVLLEPWYNSYVFTKSIAEDMVLRESKGLPICIIRPSMVIGTYKEPIPGWINNINGPAGIVTGAALGLLRTILCRDKFIEPDMVPADMVVNATIGAAWKIAHSRRGTPIPTRGTEGEDVPIFNCVSSVRNPITWNDFLEKNLQNGFHYPSERCLWYYCFFMTNSVVLHSILRVLLHLFPALLVDTFLRLTGRKPMLLKAYKKIHKFLDLTNPFGNRRWTFTDRNIQWLWSEMKESDKEIFPFNIEDFDWDETIKHMVPGLRVHFLKDPLNTVESAKKKYRRLKIIHYTLVAALFLLLLQLIWWIVTMLW